ncbi:hypothetical protein GcM3_195047 [Golovinomyces cichoracearum]|uniref:Retrovirus-related Pol polyprotein from transposon TNT 1-94-like beta-barrel domain-containing protein n=1 Tax=Golovinomyces cichoracearum TaxID=62708 RepID=A0A420HG15_9PEZI|nr:hypothetical protein GcM3_195047 [Golovinomyces cichoracearum]
MKWLDNLQRAYDKAVECELPEVTGFRSHMIEDFRNHQRQEEAMKSLEHPYLAKNLTKGVAATFKDSDAEDGGTKTTNYDYKQEKANQVTEKHPESIEVSEPRFQKAAAMLTARKTKPARKSTNDDKNNSTKALNMATNIYDDVKENFHLRDKWIIDNGADTHVTNATCNFEETRKAGADELLYAGKGAYKITSYGNVKLPLRSHVPGEYLLLTNVAYVPGIMTNCVSLNKLTKASIH